MDQLIAFVTVLVVLSGAAERLVEIIKNFSRKLSQPNPDSLQESRRQGVLHLVSVFASLVTAALAHEQIAGVIGWTKDAWTLTVCLGLLAAGGSSLWNSVLTYLLSVKDLKRAAATERKRETSVNVAGLTTESIPSTPPDGLGSTTS